MASPVVRWIARKLFPEHFLLGFFALVLVVLRIVYAPEDWHGLRDFSVQTGFWVMVCLVGIAFVTNARAIVAGEPAGRRRAFADAGMAISQWLPFVLAVTTYENLHDVTNLVRLETVDDLLMGWDQALFGVQPTVWLEQHLVTPLLTDWMAFTYSLYFFLPGAIAVLLFMRRDERLFRTFSLSILVALYLGFVGYITMPAIGPRYWLLPEYREKVISGLLFKGNASEIFKGVEAVMRDCFPSLHTALSAVTLWSAWRYRRALPGGSAWFWVFLPLITSLWASTVYLRQHWVVDVFAGWVLTVFVMTFVPWLVDGWLAWRDRTLEGTGWRNPWTHRESRSWKSGRTSSPSRP